MTPVHVHHVVDIDVTILNEPRGKDELSKAVKGLKNNKSPGLNRILKEYVRNIVDLLLSYLFIFICLIKFSAMEGYGTKRLEAL